MVVFSDKVATLKGGRRMRGEVHITLVQVPAI